MARVVVFALGGTFVVALLVSIVGVVAWSAARSAPETQILCANDDSGLGGPAKGVRFRDWEAGSVRSYFDVPAPPKEDCVKSGDNWWWTNDGMWDAYGLSQRGAKGQKGDDELPQPRKLNDEPGVLKADAHPKPYWKQGLAANKKEEYERGVLRARKGSPPYFKDSKAATQQASQSTLEMTGMRADAPMYDESS